MSKWNLVAMGEAGLTGWTRQAAEPVARAVASRIQGLAGPSAVLPPI